MTQELARDIIDTLRQIMATRDFERISCVFDIFLLVDDSAIHEAAERFISQADISNFARTLFPGENLRDRLMMQAFYATTVSRSAISNWQWPCAGAVMIPAIGITRSRRILHGWRKRFSRADF